MFSTLKRRIAQIEQDAIRAGAASCNHCRFAFDNPKSDSWIPAWLCLRHPNKKTRVFMEDGKGSLVTRKAYIVQVGRFAGQEGYGRYPYGWDINGGLYHPQGHCPDFRLDLEDCALVLLGQTGKIQLGRRPGEHWNPREKRWTPTPSRD